MGKWPFVVANKLIDTVDKSISVLTGYCSQEEVLVCPIQVTLGLQR